MISLFKTLLKFSIAFAVSYFILSAPVKHKSLFYHLFEYTAPYTQKIYLGGSYQSQKISNALNTLTRKLFALDVPSMKKGILKHENSDSIKSMNSRYHQGEDTHYIEEDEKEELKKLL